MTEKNKKNIEELAIQVEGTEEAAPAMTEEVKEAALVAQEEMGIENRDEALAPSAFPALGFDPSSPCYLYLDKNMFAQCYRVAQMLCSCSLVPDCYRGKANIYNAMVAFMTAARLKVDPMMFLQKSYVVHGKPGIEAQLAIALVNNSKTFKEGISYRLSGEGDARACTAFGTLPSGRVCEATVNMAMARDEGWLKNPKWKTMTDHMLKLRSAMFLARTVCPEVLLGLYSLEELGDVEVSRK